MATWVHHQVKMISVAQFVAEIALEHQAANIQVELMGCGCLIMSGIAA